MDYKVEKSYIRMASNISIIRRDSINRLWGICLLVYGNLFD